MMDRPKNMKIADDTTLIRKLERQKRRDYYAGVVV